SKGDVTLLIYLPDGTWVADDDSGGGLNPMLNFKAPRAYGMGGIPSQAEPHQIVTPQKFAAILNTPSANALLMKARAALGGKSPKVLPGQRTAWLPPALDRRLANDNGPGTGNNPLIQITTPQSGNYDIYVGTAPGTNVTGAMIAATLFIAD